MLNFCTNVYESINNKKITAALFVDITKAFDTVDHKILLTKLHKCGLRGSIYDWFTSYLENRKQRVKINNAYSSLITIRSGVPQGSVLGPMLFLIYINSLFSQNFISKTVAFADDMACTFEADSVLDLTANINNDLSILKHWFSAHKLVMSDKTKIMKFSTGGVDINFGNHFTFHGTNCARHFVGVNICPTNTTSITYNDRLSCTSKCFHIECVKILNT